MEPEKTETLERHLASRRVHTRVQSTPFCDVDQDENTAVFYLWNLSGQLLGYQNYRPDKDKIANNSPREGRYYTQVSKDSYGNPQVIAWGLESLYYRRDIVFVLEGIFKCAPFHRLSIPAIAGLTNNPKSLKNFLYIISHSRKVIFIGDNDGDRTATKSGCYPIIFPPSKYKDVDDMDDGAFEIWIEEELKRILL